MGDCVSMAVVHVFLFVSSPQCQFARPASEWEAPGVDYFGSSIPSSTTIARPTRLSVAVAEQHGRNAKVAGARRRNNGHGSVSPDWRG